MGESRELYVAQRGGLSKWEVPVRELEPKQVRVKVYAASVNPIDWKTVDAQLADGAGQGNDFAGVVVEIGSEVQSVKVGDTVAGGVGGGDVDDKENGAFTNLLSVQEHLLFKFPRSLTSSNAQEIPVGKPTTFEQAASLGLVWDTALLAFDGHTAREGDYALIFGGTGALGYAAAQFARNVGYKVIVVSSPAPEIYAGQGFEVLDRHDPLWVSKARGISGDRIVLGFDTICEDRSTLDTFRAIKDDASAVLVVSQPGTQVPREVQVHKPAVKLIPTLYFLLMQEVKKFGTEKISLPEAKYLERAPELVAQINKQLAEDKVTALPIKVFNGFDQVNAALDFQRGGVHATKVVVKFI